MINKVLQNLFRGLEVSIGVLLLLFADNLNIPSNVGTALNALTYPIVLILVISQSKRIIYILSKDVSLVFLVMLALLSNIWSQSIDITSLQSRALLRNTLFATYLAARYSPVEMIRLLSSSMSISIIMSITLGIAMPSIGTEIVNGLLTWRGIYSFKQFLGRVMAISSVVFLIRSLDKKYNRLFSCLGLSSSIMLILLSQSRTSLILLITAIFLLPVYKILTQSTKIRIILFIIFGIACISVMAIILPNLEFIVVDLLGKDMEFNGRTPIWTLTIEKGLERPFFGYGYAGFWKSDDALYVLNNTWGGSIMAKTGAFHAHNGLLDIFMQLGFVGLGLFIINLISLCYRVIKIIIATKTLESFWMLQIIVIKMILNQVEVITILSPNNIFWILYVYIAFSSAVWYRRLCHNQPAI
ncbi:O-antigen ligase family protein [Anabaena sphaerica FACHB-251]|uniref:O-antigen ligase family protein n=1 Tax=Anabaena sphaerica FACHB-251 TaxID=2692883 RepID=A0A927A312_9NOST|nr:O-antigen ligase family protein [Anabaena sphaerica]MBD2295928.1 O-antigen ligase family protein [Anabaena sphaerica FACHB-251]